MGCGEGGEEGSGLQHGLALGGPFVMRFQVAYLASTGLVFFYLLTIGGCCCGLQGPGLSSAGARQAQGPEEWQSFSPCQFASCLAKSLRLSPSLLVPPWFPSPRAMRNRLPPAGEQGFPASLEARAIGTRSRVPYWNMLFLRSSGVLGLGAHSLQEM